MSSEMENLEDKSVKKSELSQKEILHIQELKNNPEEMKKMDEDRT
jgi:hypothetical protein